MSDGGEEEGEEERGRGEWEESEDVWWKMMKESLESEGLLMGL